MKQDTVIINDTNAEKIIDTILASLIDGKQAESDLELMVGKLLRISITADLETYVKYKNKIIEYIQSFYVYSI